MKLNILRVISILILFPISGKGQSCYDPLSIGITTFFYSPLEGDCTPSDRVRLKVNGTTMYNWTQVTWDFGDGESEVSFHSGSPGGDSPFIDHDYSISGSYTVTATIIMDCDPDEIVLMEETFHTQDFSDDATFSAYQIGDNLYTFDFIGLGYYENANGFEAEINFGDGETIPLTKDLFIPGNNLTTHEYASSGFFEIVLTINWYQHPATFCEVSYSQIIYIPPCNCASFHPEGGKKYWLSAWVQEEQLSPVKTYDMANIALNFYAGGLGSTIQFFPTGEIIDGWQRIVGEFTMPMDAETFMVQLNAHPTFDTYFDDIRIHPYNGSMKSYVYDGETFWLTSELDDNNYATFYEYDEEGGLVRIKKETSQGIVTIQETRSNTIKQDDETE